MSLILKNSKLNDINKKDFIQTRLNLLRTLTPNKNKKMNKIFNKLFFIKMLNNKTLTITVILISL